MGRLVVAMMVAATLAACGGEDATTADVSQPLVPGPTLVTGPTTCAWPDLGHLDLGRPHSSYAVDGVFASCARGWVERSTDLELVDATTIRASFREYEVGCGDIVTRCTTFALLERE